MKREECYMTFSEALVSYLNHRDTLRVFGEGRNRNEALENMQIALEHMDALTEINYSALRPCNLDDCRVSK